MCELPLGTGLLVTRRTGRAIRVLDGRDLVTRIAVGALRRVDEGELLAWCVAGLALLGLRGRFRLVVTGVVTARAAGLVHVVAAGAPFGRVPRYVRDAAVHGRDASTELRLPW